MMPNQVDRCLNYESCRCHRALDTGLPQWPGALVCAFIQRCLAISCGRSRADCAVACCAALLPLFHFASASIYCLILLDHFHKR